MAYYLAYVSSASPGFERTDLDDVLSTSRVNNADLGVSGALLAKGGNFMQVLEGERQVVTTLYDRIGRDPRHRGLMVLLRGHQDSRQFADWSMAFGDLDAAGAAGTGRLGEFLSTPSTSADFGTDPSACQRLLLSFRRNLTRR